MYLAKNPDHFILSLTELYSTNKIGSKEKYWRPKDPANAVKLPLDDPRAAGFCQVGDEPIEVKLVELGRN